MGKPRKASKRRNINKWARLGRQRWPKDAEAKGDFSEKGVCQADTEKNRVTEPHVAQLQEHHSCCVVRLHLLGGTVCRCILSCKWGHQGCVSLEREAKWIDSKLRRALHAAADLTQLVMRHVPKFWGCPGSWMTTLNIFR